MALPKGRVGRRLPRTSQRAARAQRLIDAPKSDSRYEQTPHETFREPLV
jgi:hypothetical protein